MNHSFIAGLLIAATSARYLDGRLPYSMHPAPHHHEDVERHIVDHESDPTHYFHGLPHDVYNPHPEMTPLEYMHDFGHHDYHVVPKAFDAHLEFGEWGEHVPLPDYHHSHHW